jgi:hypothetical protein
MGENQQSSQCTKEEQLLALMSALLLLRNVMIHKTNSPADNRYRIILDSRQLGDPGYHRPEDLRKYDEEASLMIDRFERDPAISNRVAELRAMGFNPHFAVYDEPWVRMLMFYLPFNPDAEARLRDEAKSAAGVRTSRESEEFDRRLELYINQRYATDWLALRERFPLVEFP